VARYSSQIGESAVVWKFHRRHHAVPSNRAHDAQVTRGFERARFFI
jgi:hypothetical protein